MTYQFMMLYASFGLMSIGAGGIRASSPAFGADQLINKEDNHKNAGILRVTLAAISFFLASPFYVKLNPKTNLIIGLAQVVVASYKNRHIKISISLAIDEIMYHRRKDSYLLMPSDKLRFLNKACIIRNPEQDLTPDGKASDPWSLCTIDQVEELKALIKVIPIWSTGIIFSLTISASSLSMFMMITLVLWIALYDRIIIPLASKIRGKPTYLSMKLRMGIGLLFSVASMASWAIAESKRRELAIKEGFSDEPQAMVDMSVMWLLPHFVLTGLAEAFYTVAENEFLYTEFPKSMSSISSSLSGVGVSVANLVASIILNGVDYFTNSRGSKESWIADNINKGHYDYYFWLISCLCVVNFLYYLACIKAYVPCK
ncbi:hypothetical protein EZV62_013384 [Acer yangbiense]|uniref:Protein NRT1/ PTR FAMILY 1.2-like n=1 Tax=Acer yangbiense TaxID=1000413 RepID=A0A5C7HY35_9ROSI|nr:hypothetical protein EZV62_013384 [Acer yangbiense]